MPHKYHAKILPRNEDLDTEPRYMKEGAMAEIVDGRMGESDSESQYAWTNIRGTKEVETTLPEGDNVCVWRCDDKKNQRFYYGIYNSNGYNGIYAYQPQNSFEKIKLLFSDTPTNKILDFSPHHGGTAKVLDSKYLIWMQRNYKPPRILRLEWCYVEKKQWLIEDNPTYTITVDSAIKIIKKEELSFYFKVDDCDCMKVTQIDDATIDGVALNFYDTPHNERQIDFVNWPLSTAPKVEMKSDIKFKRNLVSGFTWQFRTKLKYIDGSYSVWSPWSKMMDTTDQCLDNFNYMVIDYSDPIFDLFGDDQQLQNIDKVILGYRNTNIGELHSFTEISICQAQKTGFTYNFYNDIYAELQPQQDNQKQYDVVPLQAGALEIIEDRVGFGDVTENYDGDCGNFELDVTFHPKKKEETGTIKCDIRVWNMFFIGTPLQVQPIARYAGNSGPEGTNQDYTSTVFGGMGIRSFVTDGFIFPDRFDQYIPDGGWYGYLRGTDFKALSKQVHISGVDYFNADRGIIDLSSASKRQKYRDEIAGKDLKSELEIHNVPYGTYIFTLASHLVSQPIDGVDKLGYGDYYNAENGLYQKSSTQIAGIIENGIFKYGVKEIVVVVDSPEVQLPDFVIQDSTNPREADRVGSILTCGYVLDNDGFSGSNTSLDKVKLGTPVELAEVNTIWTPTLGATGLDIDPSPTVRLTDHNGFYFDPVIFDFRIRTGDYQFHMTANERTMPDTVFINTNNNVYRGILSSIYDGSAEEKVNSFLTVELNRNTHINIPNYNPNISKNNRTHITGYIKNQNGDPLKGVKIVCTDTGRVEVSGSDGSYSLLVYVKSGGHTRKGKIIFYDERGCITKDFTVKDFNLTLGVGHYTSTNDYRLDLVINTEDFGTSYFLKNGDTYDFGRTLNDRANRKTTVQFNEEKHRLRLPFTTERIKDYFPDMTTDADGGAITASTKANGHFTVAIKFNEAPPIWTTHSLLMRTPGQVYADHIQMVVSDVKYVERFDLLISDDPGGEPVADPIYTTFGSSTANEIYLDLNTTFVEYQKRNSESKKGWAFEKGDRLRFILDSNGELRDFVEVEIKEQRGNYFVIPVIDSLSEIKQGELVEVFRIKTKTEKHLFYEIGEYNKVLNPYTEDRAWENTTVHLVTGDAYRRRRKMYAKNIDRTVNYIYDIEDPSPSDATTLKDNDIGRADFVNSNYKQLRREDIIRFSGQYIPSSLINNVHSFNGLDEVGGSKTHGPITLLWSFNDDLFVAQYSKCHTRHINKLKAFLGDGKTLEFDSDRFLSPPYYLTQSAGCRNPESSQQKESGCFFFDSHNGKVWEYNRQAGLQNVSGYDDHYKRSGLQEKYFNSLAVMYKLIPDDLHEIIAKCHGGFDPKNKEYNLTIKEIGIKTGDSLAIFNGNGVGSNIGDSDPQFKMFDTAQADFNISAKTVVYCDRSGGSWLGKRSYEPEMFGFLGNEFFSLLNGKFYEMEKGDKCGWFYGVKYNQVLTPVMNISPSDLKRYFTFSLETNLPWSNPFVKVFNTRAFRDIESKTPDTYIKKMNGGYYSHFLKDSNTPNVQLPLYNGDDLVGETLLMRIENSSDEQVVMYAINIYADYVPRTNF